MLTNSLYAKKVTTLIISKLSPSNEEFAEGEYYKRRNVFAEKGCIFLRLINKFTIVYFFENLES